MMNKRLYFTVLRLAMTNPNFMCKKSIATENSYLHVHHVRHGLTGKCPTETVEGLWLKYHCHIHIIVIKALII